MNKDNFESSMDKTTLNGPVITIIQTQCEQNRLPVGIDKIKLNLVQTKQLNPSTKILFNPVKDPVEELIPKPMTTLNSVTKINLDPIECMTSDF